MFNTLRETQEQRPYRAPAAPSSESAEAEAGTPRYLRVERELADAGVPDAGVGPVDASVLLPAGVEEATSAPPTGPNACATNEEEAEKERFRRRTFSRLDFRPSAGYGKFDAYYWPRSSLMAARVKIKFNYQPADDMPPLATLMNMVRNGQSIRQFFWTGAQKRQYERDYVRRVSQQWSFKQPFRSIKPCWNFRADPHITPVVVDDVSDAHFNPKAFKMSSPTGFRGSEVSARNTGAADWRGGGELDQNDIIEDPDNFSSDVATTERNRIQQAITATTASPVTFEHNRSVIRPPFGARLRSLADVLKAKNPSAPDIPIMLRGFASAEGSRGRNDTLSRERAEAVAGELTRRGVSQPLTIDPQGPVGAPNDAANRKVEIAPNTTFETTYGSNRYLAAGHEFGHMLGLPDDYNDYSGEAAGHSLRQKQGAFTRLAQQAGVDAPDWGETSTSVMSVGVDVLPRHYLTVWEALGAMTSPQITRNQWRIG